MAKREEPKAHISKRALRNKEREIYVVQDKYGNWHRGKNRKEAEDKARRANEKP